MKSGTVLRLVRYEGPSSSASNSSASSSEGVDVRLVSKMMSGTHQLRGRLHLARLAPRTILPMLTGSRLLVPASLPCHNAYSVRLLLSLRYTHDSKRSHLDLVNIDLSILPPHLFISDLHCVHRRHCVSYILSCERGRLHVERLLHELLHL